MKQLERYTIALYDRSSSLDDVNICRKQLFTKKGCIIENLPPTRDALIQHVRRACFRLIYGNNHLYLIKMYQTLMNGAGLKDMKSFLPGGHC